MHISLNWIKDFVELPEMSPKELGSRFTLTTAEVEGITAKGQGQEKVHVVQVLWKKPHPEADKLNLVTFDNGQGQKEVVCGAPNVREGMKVFYAPSGTVLPSGLTLEPKKIRGILSDGMLCSEADLGIGEGHSGLMELPADTQLGASIKEVLKLESDVIFEVDNKSLTHRPDLWGHYGLAREFAASHQKPLKNPFNRAWEQKMEAKLGQFPGPISFTVDSDSACWAYLGVSLSGVKVGTSPDWIKNRLQAVGLRPINSIVDISNYVMTELGMPNHIFDAEKIGGGKLKISRLGLPARFQTLDGTERELIASDTVISDSEGPTVLAGIMGGLKSGVTDGTTNIFIEVANWDPSEVRKTSVRLGLRSDSSQRYEKTLDSHQCKRALLRLVELILEQNPSAQVTGQLQSWFKEETLAKPVTLKFPRQRITKVIGQDLSVEKLTSLFTSLDFKVEANGDDFVVTVPTYRTTKDISCVDDLVEEVGRLIGYDNIVPLSPMLAVRPVRLSTSKVLQRKIQDFMVLQGKALEVMTYPLVGAELLKMAAWPEKQEHMVLVNALSKDQDRMRPSLIPSALQLVAENQKHYSDFAFYEIGRSYPNFESERSQLLVGLYSREGNRYLELLNLLERLLGHLSLPFEFAPRQDKFPNPLAPVSWSGNHPHEFSNVRIQGKFHGVAMTVHPLVMKSFKVRGNFAVAVIDLTDFEKREVKDKTKYQPISKFPSSSFDISVTAKMDVAAGDVVKALSNSLKLRQLKSVSLLGTYAFSDVEKSVTIRTVFEDPTTTLTADFLKEAEKQVVQALEKAGFPLRV